MSSAEAKVHASMPLRLWCSQPTSVGINNQVQDHRCRMWWICLVQGHQGAGTLLNGVDQCHVLRNCNAVILFEMGIGL